MFTRMYGRLQNRAHLFCQNRDELNSQSDIYIYLPGKLNLCDNLQKSGEAYIGECDMDNLIYSWSKFWDTSIGEKIFGFGGHIGELESPKVWAVTKISTFGGRKYDISFFQK